MVYRRTKKNKINQGNQRVFLAPSAGERGDNNLYVYKHQPKILTCWSQVNIL